MKKIFIIAAGVFLLCLTSCASKKAPEEMPVTEAPQTDITEKPEAESDTVMDSEGETSQDTAAAAEKEAESISEAPSEKEIEMPEIMTSEDFPEPDLIEEPEITTLEPADEIIEAEDEPAAEKVTIEEPPLIVNNENEGASGSTQNLDDTQADTITLKDEEATASTDTKDESDITITSDDEVIVVNDEDEVKTEDKTETTDEADDETTKEIDIIKPSRSVTLKKFEYLDVTYPGTGWIYMGLTDNSKDLAYFGRKLGTKDTKFSLQARNAGTKIIHFYKNDPLSGHYLDDYVEVIILPENGSNKTHIDAPEYKLPVQKKEEPVEEKKIEDEGSVTEDDSSSETTSNTSEKEDSASSSTEKNSSTSVKTETSADAATISSTTTETETTETEKTDSTSSAEDVKTEADSKDSTETVISSVQTSTSPETLLQEAQVLYNEKEYAAALAKLNQFFEYSTDNRDSALYLKGQILEAKSEIRDIKGAMEAYTSLTKNYPASKLWDSANKRIIYLKRFYLEVR